MPGMETVFFAMLILLPVLYTLLVMGYARLFVGRVGGLGLFVRPLLVGTIIFHSAAILLQGFLVGACPLGSQGEMLSLVALSMAVIYLCLEVRSGERATGVFVLAPAFLLQMTAAVSILAIDPPVEQRLGALPSIETFAAVVGFSAVAVAGIYGTLYLFLYTAIKRGQYGFYYQKMPSLETLFRLDTVAVTVGFLVLTIAVAIGVTLASRAGVAPNLELSLTLGLWALAGLCVLGRAVWSLGGKRLAYSSMVGLVLVICILVSGFWQHGAS